MFNDFLHSEKIVEEQKEQIRINPNNPEELIVDKKFLMEFISNTRTVIAERDSHLATLHDVSNDFNTLKGTINFFDEKFGLFKMMAPGSKVSITGLTTKMIKAFKDISNNPQQYKDVGTKLNTIIQKVTNENHVFNQLGNQQLAIGSHGNNGSTGSEPPQHGSGHQRPERTDEGKQKNFFQRIRKWISNIGFIGIAARRT